MAFAEKKAKNGKTISTDGTHVWSYNMMIARTIPETGGVELINYNMAPSNTTRSHIRAVENFFAPASIERRVDKIG